MILYVPEKPEKNSPIVLALPGCITEEEATRKNATMHKILEGLRQQGIFGILHAWIKVKKKDNQETCDFDLRETAIRAPCLLEDAIHCCELKAPRIGLITNSMSALIGNIMLTNTARDGRLTPKSYASISPITGWEYFLNETKRKAFEEQREKILTGTFGRKPRFIAAEKIPFLTTLDYKKQLDGYKPNGINVMTLSGANDMISRPRETVLYHEKLGGLSEDLIQFEGLGHFIPNPEKYVVPFMEKTLKVSNSPTSHQPCI